jgi:hypothetical protein
MLQLSAVRDEATVHPVKHCATYQQDRCAVLSHQVRQAAFLEHLRALVQYTAGPLER